MPGSTPPNRPSVVAFDIIDTVFPLEPLRQPIVALGLPPGALETWFAIALRDAFALSAAGDFAPFPAVLQSALDDVLAQQGASAPDAARQALLQQVKQLPPRPDAREALETLHRAGMRIVAISNGPRASTQSLLQGGGLADLVDPVLSVDDIRIFKPRQEVYQHVARTVEVEAGSIALVAVHAWDLNGAKAAGFTTAFLAGKRPFPPLMRQPDVEAPSLAAVARKLIAL